MERAKKAIYDLSDKVCQIELFPKLHEAEEAVKDGKGSNGDEKTLINPRGRLRIPMKKITIYIFILCLLFLSSGCGNPKEEAGQQERENTVTVSSPPETEELLREKEVLDLGDHMIAYYMPREELDTAYTRHGYETYQGERYIVIRDLDNDAAWYLPDVYGTIVEIGVEGAFGLSLGYIPQGAEELRRACIPICFFEREEEEVMDFDPFCYREKSIFGGQEGLKAGEDVLPQPVWEEAFCRQEETYTIQFERVSPIYNPGYESGEIQADYCLTVQDGEKNVLSRQMIFHYPVAYEETCWRIDFSGDGFLDLAFCTDVFRGGKYGSWSSLKILIWNEDTCCYEERGIDGKENMPVWNRDMASLVICAETENHSESYRSKEMYTWLDGQWQRTGRLERVYSETEFYDMPGEGEYPCSDGYLEQIYANGELMEENRIEEDFYENDAFWFEKSCIWSDNYEGGIRLYPNWPEWEKAETTVGGMVINKYVRAAAKAD